tara:strand:- start:2518 stop:2916 length:399 start_codon:yes stop_codon:yes gene_type:complete
MSDQSEHEVGYKKPPKHSQWKPGQSGNPNGRPKKTKDFNKLLDIELSKEVSITEGGRKIVLSKREILLKSLVNDALKGDLRAMKMVLPFLTSQQSIAGFEPDAADRQAFEQLIQSYQQIGETAETEASHDKP